MNNSFLCVGFQQVFYLYWIVCLSINRFWSLHQNRDSPKKTKMCWRYSFDSILPLFSCVITGLLSTNEISFEIYQQLAQVFQQKILNSVPSLFPHFFSNNFFIFCSNSDFQFRADISSSIRFSIARSGVVEEDLFQTFLILFLALQFRPTV